MQLHRDGSWPGVPSWGLDHIMSPVTPTWSGGLLTILWSLEGSHQPNDIRVLALGAGEIINSQNGWWLSAYVWGGAALQVPTPVYPIDVFVIPVTFPVTVKMGTLAHARLEAP